MLDFTRQGMQKRWQMFGRRLQRKLVNMQNMVAEELLYILAF